LPPEKMSAKVASQGHGRLILEKKMVTPDENSTERSGVE